MKYASTEDNDPTPNDQRHCEDLASVSFPQKYLVDDLGRLQRKGPAWNPAVSGWRDSLRDGRNRDTVSILTEVTSPRLRAIVKPSGLGPLELL